MLNNQKILIVSNQMWRDRWKGPVHYFTEILARVNQVVFVEGNYSLGKMGLGMLKGNWPVAPFGRRITISKNLSVFTPPPRLPYRHFLPGVGRINQKILRRSILQSLPRWGFTDYLLWVFIHQASDLVGRIGERASIYHCVDDWSRLLPRGGIGSEKVIDCDERALVRKVNLVIGTSQFLSEKMQKVNPNSFYIPNAFSHEIFSRATQSETPLPEDLQRLNSPIIGFVGSLEKKSDLDLIRYVALERPHWSVVIVGYLGEVPDLYKIRGLPNVHLLGMRPLEEVPSYLKGFDVCMVPFKMDQLTESISPQKFYEYLASGKPIVSTKIREVEQFSSLIEIAAHYDEFIQKIEKALDERDRSARDQRIRVASENTWTHRVEAASQVVQRIIGGSPGPENPQQDLFPSHSASSE